MGATGKGILDNFNGAVGTVVGSTWKGRAVMKSRPGRRKNKNFTEAQLDTHAKLRAVVAHMQSMSALVAESFTDVSGAKTEFNAAVSYAYNNALTGSYPNYELDFTKIKVSSGKLLPAQTSSAVLDGNNIRFTWSTETVARQTNPLDTVIMVAYCPADHLCFFNMTTIPRLTGGATLNVDYFKGKLVHTYIGFISEKGDKASISKYTGQFTV